MKDRYGVPINRDGLASDVRQSDLDGPDDREDLRDDEPRYVVESAPGGFWLVVDSTVDEEHPDRNQGAFRYRLGAVRHCDILNEEG